MDMLATKLFELILCSIRDIIRDKILYDIQLANTLNLWLINCGSLINRRYS